MAVVSFVEFLFLLDVSGVVRYLLPPYRQPPLRSYPNLYPLHHARRNQASLLRDRLHLVLSQVGQVDQYHPEFSASSVGLCLLVRRTSAMGNYRSHELPSDACGIDAHA